MSLKFEVPVVLDVLDHPQQVIVDIAEVRVDLFVNQLVPSAGQTVERLGQRNDGGVEAEHLALQVVDALSGVAGGE